VPVVHFICNDVSYIVTLICGQLRKHSLCKIVGVPDRGVFKVWVMKSCMLIILFVILFSLLVKSIVFVICDGLTWFRRRNSLSCS
jgi:hypothetical protein